METFLKDFSQVSCYLHHTDPIGIEDNILVVKIIYKNGEYELIDAGGQAQYTNERRFRNYTGYRSFDDIEFKNLISKYSEEQSEN